MASIQLTAGKEADLGSAEFALFWTEVRAPISLGLISHAVKTFLSLTLLNKPQKSTSINSTFGLDN